MQITEYVEMTKQTRTLDCGTTLHRVRATKDLPHHGVKAGTLGGWVQYPENLDDRAWVGDDAIIYEGAIATDLVLIRHNAVMRGYARAVHRTLIEDSAQMTDHSRAYTAAMIRDKTMLTGSSVAGDRCELRGTTHLSEYASVGNTAYLVDCEIFGEMHIDTPVSLRGVSLYNRSHLIFGEVQTSIRMNHTAWYTEREDGTIEIYGKVGCWEGTADQLLALAESETWVETRPCHIPTYRPELLAVAHQWLARQEHLRAMD